MPRQAVRLAGVLRIAAGPPADVYGFAKTCCYALFETTEPTFQDWQKVPTEWAELLGHCLNKNPERRPARFADVLDRLSRLPTARPAAAVPEPSTYAAFAGLGALGLVFWHRRRTRIAAHA